MEAKPPNLTKEEIERAIAYTKHVLNEVESAVIGELEKIEGKVPTNEEIAQYGRQVINSKDYSMDYYWKNVLLVQCQPNQTQDGVRRDQPDHPQARREEGGVVDLRLAPFKAVKREVTPFIELAVERHPNPVDIRLIQGNPVTAHDYVRRVLIEGRKNGLGKYSAHEIKALKPPLRVYYCKEGIAIAGVARKRRPEIPNYKPPFKVDLGEEGRWVTLAVLPSKEEIVQIANMMARGVLESPVELRTKFCVTELEEIIGNRAEKIHIFRTGRNKMLWPRKFEASE